MDSEFLYKDDTYEIIGICMEVHKILGHGFLEIVYKDAIEHELLKRNLDYSREREYKIQYKEIIGGFADAYVAQMLNYLKASGCKVGLLVNFGRSKLEYKRLVL